MADIIVGRLGVYCQKIKVAGSIRRGRPMVGDIDLVLLPKPHSEFALRTRIKSRSEVVTDGAQNLIVKISNGVQLDCFFARHPEENLLGEIEPGNWGTLLVCRTGSKEHNIHLAQHALRNGMRWDPYRGVIKDGQVIAWESERHVFDALGLDFLPPEKRER